MHKLIGNAIVGQSGGPTAAINATLAGVVRGVLENVHEGTIPTLYGMRNGVEGLLREDIVNLSEFFADAEKISVLEQTPAAALGLISMVSPTRTPPESIPPEITRESACTSPWRLPPERVAVPATVISP